MLSFPPLLKVYHQNFPTTHTGEHFYVHPVDIQLPLEPSGDASPFILCSQAHSSSLPAMPWEGPATLAQVTVQSVKGLYNTLSLFLEETQATLIKKTLNRWKYVLKTKNIVPSLVLDLLRLQICTLKKSLLDTGRGIYAARPPHWAYEPWVSGSNKESHKVTYKNCFQTLSLCVHLVLLPAHSGLLSLQTVAKP